MTAYRGTHLSRGCFVTVECGPNLARPLQVRPDLYDGMVLGLEWGYAGKGPRALAVALLADATGDDQLAVELAELYMLQVISELNFTTWRLTKQEVCDWVNRQRPGGPVYGDGYVIV